MRFTTQLALFISSYTPLFLIIILKYFNTHFYESFALICVLIIANSILFAYIWGIVKTRSNRVFKVKKSINRTSDTLNYLLPYVFAFLGLQLTNWADILSLIILLSVVFVIYIRSNLILMNPLLNALGFKFYVLEINKGENIVVICKKDLKADITIKTKRISKGLYLLEDS